MLRQVAWARTFGLALELISAEHARELFGLMSIDRVRCASYLPSDGYLDPSLLPHEVLREALDAAVRTYGHAVLAYGANAGPPLLRSLLAGVRV